LLESVAHPTSRELGHGVYSAVERELTEFEEATHPPEYFLKLEVSLGPVPVSQDQVAETAGKTLFLSVRDTVFAEMGVQYPVYELGLVEECLEERDSVAEGVWVDHASLGRYGHPGA
jgi:hypothetical protein